MRRRIALFLTVAVLLIVGVRLMKSAQFTPSAYWTNPGAYNNTTYEISQTNSPDGTSDYTLMTTTLPFCYVDPYDSMHREIDHHIHRATSNYNFSTGSAYDVVYDTKRCGFHANPRLTVYKVVNGYAWVLLDVELPGYQTGLQFVSFIRNDGSNPGLHIQLGINEWHVSDTSIATGYPGYAYTNGTFTQWPVGSYPLVPYYFEMYRVAPAAPTNLQTQSWAHGNRHAMERFLHHAVSHLPQRNLCCHRPGHRRQ